MPGKGGYEGLCCDWGWLPWHNRVACHARNETTEVIAKSRIFNSQYDVDVVLSAYLTEYSKKQQKRLLQMG